MPVTAPRTPRRRRARESGIGSPPAQAAAAPEPGAFLQDYATQLARLCRPSASWIAPLVAVKDILVEASRRGGKAIVVGNGGSAAIASHVAVDLTKNARIRAVNFNEADLITCFANDYGYERWMEKAIECYGKSGDVLIAVSSSGRSKNILNACLAARRLGFAAVVTLSGFSPDNPLRRLGDHNLFAESRAYNLVELTHQFWLLALADLIIGRTEYPASPGDISIFSKRVADGKK